MEANTQACLKRLASLNEKIDEEEEEEDAFLFEKEQMDEAKLRLIEVEGRLRGLKEVVGQERLAWTRLEAELTGLQAVNVEHRFQTQLAEIRGHVSLERLRTALIHIKVRSTWVHKHFIFSNLFLGHIVKQRTFSRVQKLFLIQTISFNTFLTRRLSLNFLRYLQIMF